MEQLQQQMEESKSDDRDEAYNKLYAALQLLRRGLKDKIFAVYRQAWTLLNYILKTYLPKHQSVTLNINILFCFVSSVLLQDIENWWQFGFGQNLLHFSH